MSPKTLTLLRAYVINTGARAHDFPTYKALVAELQKEIDRENRKRRSKSPLNGKNSPR